MRIISGKFKGRNIHPPSSLPARPTTDFAKTGLFNILQSRIDLEGISILDLFGGTGNISLEFLSRGAKDVCYVEENIRCLKFFSEECKKLALTNVKFHKVDVFNFLNNCNQAFDLIFADPPYDKGLAEKIPSAVFEKKLLQKNGLLIVEHSEKLNLKDEHNFKEKRKYGNVCFSIFSLAVD